MGIPPLVANRQPANAVNPGFSTNVRCESDVAAIPCGGESPIEQATVGYLLKTIGNCYHRH
jgi:hypothetical protein